MTPTLRLDHDLFNFAQRLWAEEEESNFKRIRTFREPNALAAIEALSSMSASERKRTAFSLTKRVRNYLKASDPLFLTQDDQTTIGMFLDRVGRLAIPGGSIEIAMLEEKHLRKCADPSGYSEWIQLRKKLMHRTEMVLGPGGFRRVSLGGGEYDFTRMVLLGRVIFALNATRKWEFTAGVTVVTSEQGRLLENENLLGTLGIAGTRVYCDDCALALSALESILDHCKRIVPIAEASLRP